MRIPHRSSALLPEEKPLPYLCGNAGRPWDPPDILLAQIRRTLCFFSQTRRVHARDWIIAGPAPDGWVPRRDWAGDKRGANLLSMKASEDDVGPESLTTPSAKRKELGITILLGCGVGPWLKMVCGAAEYERLSMALGGKKGMAVGSWGASGCGM